MYGFAKTLQLSDHKGIGDDTRPSKIKHGMYESKPNGDYINSNATTTTSTEHTSNATIAPNAATTPNHQLN